MLFIVFCLLPVAALSQAKHEVIFFYSNHCKICQKLEQDFLPAIKEKYKDKLDWKHLETSSNAENFSLMLSASERFQRKTGYVPAVLVGDTYLVGESEIRQFLVSAIDTALFNKPKPLQLVRVDLLNFFKEISLWAIIGAGLIDGINPCAFAVIVFFVSFLGVHGYRKREIIWVGSFYCAAVFITYFLMGLGLFQFLYEFEGIEKIISLFYFFVGYFCFVLAIFAFHDYYKFNKTGQTDGMVLQLPKFLKKRINMVIGAGLRQRQDRGVASLAVASFLIGLLVSLLEAVCTGQVYVPTIVYILKTSPEKFRALTYLLIYNTMFILPLIVIFLLSFLGVSSIRFNTFLKRHIGVIKLCMIFIFLMLGVLILQYA